MSRSENVAVSRENHEIIKNNGYRIGDTAIPFSHTLKKQQQVKVYTPDLVKDLREREKIIRKKAETNVPCRFIVANVDSFYAASDLVMNFANSFHPGGGYIRGASAQEEALCRQSTLYASISSSEADEMYEYNLRVMSPFDSDYMLFSPVVEVFRDEDLSFLQKPYTTAVLTIPAPNLNQMARGQAQEKIDEVMKQRIRQYLLCAMENGCRRLTLGAWGCGAFGHDAKRVAGYFYEIFMQENWQQYFTEVLFAVLDKADYPYNYLSFAETFEKTAFCINPREENAAPAFYVASQEFPLWELPGEEQENPDLWLITSGGFPAAVRKVATAGEEWALFFLPEIDEKQFFHLQKAGSAKKLVRQKMPVVKNTAWRETACKEEEENGLLSSFADLLEDMLLVTFLTGRKVADVSLFEVSKGRRLICFAVCLKKDGEVLARSMALENTNKNYH